MTSVASSAIPRPSPNHRTPPSCVGSGRSSPRSTSAFAGYVEWVTDSVALRAIGARRPVREALRRRRVERSSDERAAEALFGLRLDQDALDRGEAFVRGVVERGGDAELGKLWTAGENLPTPAEVDAPGLWIARVNLPETA